MKTSDYFDREGVRWTDEQQRLGWLYFIRTTGVLLAVLAVAAVVEAIR